MKAKLNFATTLLLLAVGLVFSGAGAEDEPFNLVNLTLGSADFGSGDLQQLALTPEGLQLEPDSAYGHFTSLPIEASIPFNALVPTWTAQIPEGANLTLQLRTAPSSGDWSEWFTLALNDDWMEPDDQALMGQMIAVPAVDVTHEWIQVKAAFSRYGNEPSALLNEITLTLIDTTRGPTADELVARQRVADGSKSEQALSGYPKPFVISRDIWCTDPACDYSNGLEYEPVTHLILHHTVSSNSSSDWAATVRAIWSFHTFTRGWGDIGYNYLVDMNGVLYEGHLGGDDVVGTHAAGANAGSMALALIGTFTATSPGISPPAAMRNSAADLFAWKADQKDIDVYDASYLPNMSWGLPHLMGHRDVYGTTQCPGDQAHVLLPWLRDEVARRIGFYSPNIYYDELDGSFIKHGDDYWYTPPYGCGFKGHAYYTWSTTDPGYSTNWAEWRPSIAEGGFYTVEVYAPYCRTGEPETLGATYKVTHSDGTATVIVNQQAHIGTWMSLGDYFFNAGNSANIQLKDLTTTDSGRGVWFDAIRLRPVIGVRNMTPASGQWITQRNVTFSWNVSSPSSVSSTRIRVATDAGLSNLIVNKTLSGSATSYSHTFDRDYSKLYWQVKLTTNSGYTSSSAIQQTGVDTQPPSTSLRAIYLLKSGRFVLSIQGSDAISGIAGYNVDYRPQGGSWGSLYRNATSSTLSFTPSPGDNQVYEFRSQAVDVAGLVEPFPSKAELSTGDAIFLPHGIIFPLIFH